MMKTEIIDYFQMLTKIPHCSKMADNLLTYLEDFGTARGYSVEIDQAKNILITKGNPKLALQAHYDMVCMGKAPHIETYIKEGWMYAKGSSLGADNGMAIAMMMVLMERGEDLEFLLTADEEVGLIGASALDFDLKSAYMLNLDFEDEAQVCIGCAGGLDIVATKQFEKTHPLVYFYEVRVNDLPGGHSGVDIDKGIPNAIKVLAEYLHGQDIVIASFHGGEKANAIPADALAIVSSDFPLEDTEMVKVKELDVRIKVYDMMNHLTRLINNFTNGVLSYNDELSLPDTSINLGILNYVEGKVELTASARAMSAKGLKQIEQEYQKFFEVFEFETTITEKYPSWKPEVNAFTKEVHDAMMEVYHESAYKAIHAGLECGVISKRYPTMQFASIGPTIVNPHSTRERVNLDSVGKIFKVVEAVIRKVN